MNDSEFKIYFDRKSLLQALVDMEEDNLFLIKHVAEEDQSLDELKKLKEKNI